MDPEPRCFQLNEEAEFAMLDGEYGRAAELFWEGSLCAFTPAGAAVLRDKARAAERQLMAQEQTQQKSA